jgi:lysophospholipase L1-like esterase
MSVPLVPNPDKSKLKRARSDDSSRATELSIDEGNVGTGSLSSDPCRQSTKCRVETVVIVIFLIGFIAGQIFPRFKDSRIIQHGVVTTLAPQRWPLRDDDILKAKVTPYNIDPVTVWSDDAFSPSLLEALQTESLSLEAKIQLLPYAQVRNEDMLSLYSAQAYQTLQEKLRPKSTFRILINGGSSSAGAGDVGYEDSFFVRFANTIETKYSVVTDIVNRAHGDRNSMHSAMLGETFFVPDVDLIIWEFSINDQRDGATDVRNEFILWLRKLSDIYQDKPPLVLLVYLWNKPFSTNRSGKIIADVYKQHARLGAEYDFVLGHVSLASYLDSLQWSTDDLARYFLNDTIHPNALAHAAIANMMVDFVAGDMIPIKHVFESQTEFEWTCGDDMQDQWQIQQIFVGEIGGMAKASFTAEVPRTNDTILPGMLVPHKEFTNGSVDYDYQRFSTLRYGKANPGRVDRHRGVIIPCCLDGTLVFDLTEQTHITAIQFLLHEKEGVDGGYLGRRKLPGFDPLMGYLDGVDIQINYQDYTSHVVSAHDWNCLLSNDLFSQWIVLDDKDRDYPDRVSFCSRHSWCGSDVHTLEHLVLF